MYCASKVFTTYLGECLNFEWKDKVDVLSYRPGNVDTNMNPDKYGQKDFIFPERSAFTCFRDLGLMSMTYGDWNHHKAVNFMMLIPKGMLHGFIYNALK